MYTSMISVIMPVRNEADYIEHSLGCVLAQDYPPELLEILVVDGMSDDGTREKVQKIITELRTCKDASSSKTVSEQSLPKLYLLDNPGQIVPIALNIGLRQARGDIIVRLDGHCEIPPDYLTKCVEVLNRTGADNVGGPLLTRGKTLAGQAIALATSSFFGVGGSHFRCSTRPGWVDTIFPGAFRRDVFQRIGGFDEELVKNQDDEFNFRLVQAGGKIWLDPSIRVTYYSRNSFKGLWRQYFQYGLYKVRVIQKRGKVLSWRHLVPAVFILGLIFSALLALITKRLEWAFAVFGPYIIANLFASLWSARKNWPSLLLLSLAFLIIHLSYGLGFLIGIWRWRRHWRINLFDRLRLYKSY
jgi:succinoglycan biosynthesis protein ExoA